MGIVTMGPPKEIIVDIQQKFSIDVFIESGTYQGNTALWASNIFKQVYTIENSKVLYKQNLIKYSNVTNINFVLGNSKYVLNEILAKINSPSVFWLDAHWCSGLSYGENDQCPLLDELEIINQHAGEHFIFIDDVRLFLSPPPEPNISEQWPNIQEIISKLDAKNNNYVAIIDDVLISVPLSAKEYTIELLRKINTYRLKNAAKINFKQGLVLMKDSIKSRLLK